MDEELTQLIADIEALEKRIDAMRGDSYPLKGALDSLRLARSRVNMERSDRK